MRILHTSDWHLGKKLFKKERLPEQILFLNWLLEVIKTKRPNVLVIAGDVFDTPIPTTESLSTFFQFLKDLEGYSEKNGGSLKKVLVLAGNHDSAKLLESPRPFLNHDFCKIVGLLEGPKDTTLEGIEKWRNKFSITIKEDQKIIQFCLLPFFRTREILDNPWIKNESKLHDEEIILTALRHWLENLVREETTDKVLIGHHLYGSFLASGSEQGVGLSGLDSIPLRIFPDWKLLLLGHIHKSQILRKDPPAVYCGSPLPLRFSESNEKFVYFYEDNSDYAPEDISIPCFRPLLRVTTNELEFQQDILAEYKKYPQGEHSLGCYLELTVQQKAPNRELLEDIRNFLKDFPIDLINFYALIKEDLAEEKKINIQTINQSNTQELFSLYLNEHDLSDDQKKILKNSFSSLIQEQRDEKNAD
ncbi:MAG: exonuclease subunit SbcD [Bacteriovoracaceae bacterium]|nr:exonuclease subunit SbcD [Bacteriovoracaceae bacterium]